MCSTVQVGAGDAADAAVQAADRALTTALADPGALVDRSHDQLTGLVATLTRLQARTDALLLAAVAEVDARGTFTMDGALSAGSWLRAVAHHTPGQAARTVRTARVLRSGVLPNTCAALTAGELSGGHAAVIADAVQYAPAGAVALIEPEAVATAVEGDLRATVHLMRAFAHALDPEAADEAAVRRYARSGFTLSPTMGGTTVISGSAEETTGAVIAAAIHAAGPPVRGDDRSPARRRLDALADICRAWLDQPDSGSTGTGMGTGAGTSTGATTTTGTAGAARSVRTGRHRTQLIVTLDHNGLREPEGPTGAGADAGTASPGGTLSWVGPITAATARRLGCDSLATFVTLAPDGTVVEAGTQRRFFTTAQRRAIIARDGDRCAAPHCDRPVAWSDGHHLVAVEDGGPTTVANGALPCEAHHLMLHEGHWRLERLPDSRYRLVHPPTGRTLGPEPPRPGHNRPARE